MAGEQNKSMNEISLQLLLQTTTASRVFTSIRQTEYKHIIRAESLVTPESHTSFIAQVWNKSCRYLSCSKDFISYYILKIPLFVQCIYSLSMKVTL